MEQTETVQTLCSFFRGRRKIILLIISYITVAIIAIISIQTILETTAIALMEILATLELIRTTYQVILEQ